MAWNTNCNLKESRNDPENQVNTGIKSVSLDHATDQSCVRGWRVGIVGPSVGTRLLGSLDFVLLLTNKNVTVCGLGL